MLVSPRGDPSRVSDEDDVHGRSDRPAPPPDAVEAPSQQHPHTRAEARADHDMAEAEEAVARGSGSSDQQDSVAGMAGERGQEDRRTVWMERHPDRDR
ncbi:hypothetical protein GCM10023201_03340 [Actinomycetospora corticicola]